MGNWCIVAVVDGAAEDDDMAPGSGLRGYRAQLAGFKEAIRRKTAASGIQERSRERRRRMLWIYQSISPPSSVHNQRTQFTSSLFSSLQPSNSTTECNNNSNANPIACFVFETTRRTEGGATRRGIVSVPIVHRNLRAVLLDMDLSLYERGKIQGARS